MKSQLYLLLSALLFLLLVAGAPPKSALPTEIGPYALNYPAYFGDELARYPSNPMTKEGVFLGRMLFYEKRLSGNNKMSCGTCHQQARAFTDGKAVSRGIDGKEGRRSAMSLVNLLWVRNLFWDGRAATLEEQAAVPIQDSLEMHQSLEQGVAKLQRTSIYPPLFKLVFGSEQITKENLVKAIAQFERTLISSNSRYDQYLQGKYQPTGAELTGSILFMTHPTPENALRGANCGDCHAGPKTFMDYFHNNGLEANPKDVGREGVTKRYQNRGMFRIPSLRNIALTAPYMHDGRFKTLSEVLDHYNEHLQPSATLSPLLIEATNQRGGKSLLLTPEEKESVLAFLNMLTDSTFITDPRFSDPFVKATASRK
ncbi:cytochrome-c peroxidase [Hymenobacter negativus]|uniref:Cytochrome-c peroxidase n=1 Tax=Hymenobacter negativus TaxID=2795026 RepID=A0ABS0QCT0_9BACT|nr:cytochrome c peroxidase [Hymenobacter negativus]MBH8560489.1 cytochrome-c peroxidase [Hymenobacter negativus]